MLSVVERGKSGNITGGKAVGVYPVFSVMNLLNLHEWVTVRGCRIFSEFIENAEVIQGWGIVRVMSEGENPLSLGYPVERSVWVTRSSVTRFDPEAGTFSPSWDQFFLCL